MLQKFWFCYPYVDKLYFAKVGEIFHANNKPRHQYLAKIQPNIGLILIFHEGKIHLRARNAFWMWIFFRFLFLYFWCNNFLQIKISVTRSECRSLKIWWIVLMIADSERGEGGIFWIFYLGYLFTNNKIFLLFKNMSMK